MTNPLITIGITTYNAEDTIEQCIISAKSQLWKPIDIVIVDDCSDDQTLEVLDRVTKFSSNIRIFRNSKNSGVAISRNRILAEAKGEFIVFFDDDDVSHPERIFEQHKRITDYEKQFNEGAPVICHTARKVIYPHGEIRVEQPWARRKTRTFGPAVAGVFTWSLWDGYGSCPTCSQMARLSTYKRLGGFDPSFRRAEDTDYYTPRSSWWPFCWYSKPLVLRP